MASVPATKLRSLSSDRSMMLSGLFQPLRKKAAVANTAMMVPDDDEARVEPVAHLALIEHKLERADGEHQQPHADPVGLDVLDGSLRQITDRHQQRDKADGDVDVEHHAPGIGLGQIAAERRADHGRYHDAETEDGERLAGPVRAGRHRVGWPGSKARAVHRTRPAPGGTAPCFPGSTPGRTRPTTR